MKEKLFQVVDNQAARLHSIADTIFDHPELGHEEYKASEMIEAYLKQNGFTVERGIAGIETAIRAVYQSMEGGPSIGLLCEYDALPGIGHACGHHMQAPVAMGAAVALKEILGGTIPFKLVVYGTPDEENHVTPGKIQMLKEGYFRDIDIALIMHGGAETTTDLRTLAMRSYEVEYRGISSHAAAHPEKGRSALDALLLSFNGVEFLREHIIDSARIHYTILDNGGTPSNVIPNYAKGSFMLRAMKNSDLEEMSSRFEQVLKGAALMTQTDVEFIITTSLMAKVPVMPLVNSFYQNARLAGAVRIEEPRKQVGSTDFGNVMQIVPGIGIRIAFAPKGSGAHSEKWLEMGKTEEAHAAICTGAKTMAGIALDFINDPQLLAEAKEAWAIEVAEAN